MNKQAMQQNADALKEIMARAEYFMENGDVEKSIEFANSYNKAATNFINYLDNLHAVGAQSEINDIRNFVISTMGVMDDYLSKAANMSQAPSASAVAPATLNAPVPFEPSTPANTEVEPVSTAEASGALASTIAQNESTAIDTDPTEHTPVEQAVIDEYQGSVDDNVLQFIDKWENLKDPDYKKKISITISEVSDRAVNDIKNITGVDTTGFEHSLSGNALEHIELRHGEHGESDQSMADNNDIARIGYVLNTYDSVNVLMDSDGNPDVSKEFRNSDGSNAPIVRFEKKVNGTYFVVEAVPDSNAHKLRVVTAYMNEKTGAEFATSTPGSTDQVLNMPKNGPQPTSMTPVSANTSVGLTVPQPETAVNTENRPSDEVLSTKQTNTQNTDLNAQNGEISNPTNTETKAPAPSPSEDNRAVVDQHAKTLGKAGQRVFTELYDGETLPSSYITAMSAYYESGKQSNGAEFTGTKPVAPLTLEQAKWAFTAGQNDAAANENVGANRDNNGTITSGEEATQIHKPAETADTVNKVEQTPSSILADKIAERLKSGKEFNSSWLFEQASKAFGGTMADGTFTPKDAYDAMELGVNKALMSSDKVKNANGSLESAKNMLRQLENMLTLLPTQTKRTTEMEQFQQFSTPPNIAYAAAWVAGITNNDVVLEPSAGIGGLALWPKAWGATVYANELSERRLAVLQQLGLDEVFNENAEQIDNVLPDRVKPSVVIMNPPFSSTAGRTSKNKTSNAERHIEQALERLEPNGRLVAILGRGMSDDAPSFKKWWGDIKSEYNVRANIRIDGSNYKKYGTTFDIQMVVIDKNGSTTENTITGGYTDIAEALSVLEGIRNGREEFVWDNGQGAVRDGNIGVAGDGGRLHKRPSETTRSNDNNGRNPVVLGQDGLGVQSGNGNSDGGTRELPSTSGGTAMDTGVSKKTGGNHIGTEEVGHTLANGGGNDGLSGSNTGRGSAIRTAERVEATAQNNVDIPENIDSVYSTYTPKKAVFKGAKKHPSKLVESAAMAAVEPPDVTYTPNFSQDIIEKGILSDAQLENVTYAGQAHSQLLPDGRRKGYFIGDGTGVGKGRQIAGIILDNFNQGRKKALWISKNNLFDDAIRDWTALGGNKNDVHDVLDTKLRADIPQSDGIQFMSYNTLSYNYGKQDPRIDQISKWLGEGFDGVIVFDEAHNMANSLPTKGKMGTKKAANMALAGVELQKRFPNARVVYASATGATNVSNYAYLERLGLWGKGTAFANVQDFISKISAGGIAAMELVARDMKSMGLYMARSISYDDVTYETLQHDLSPMQTEIYNELSRAWQRVFKDMHTALRESGQTKGGSIGNFYGNLQTFYNQVLCVEEAGRCKDRAIFGRFVGNDRSYLRANQIGGGVIMSWEKLAGILGAIVLLTNARVALSKWVKPSIDIRKDIAKCKADIAEIQKHERNDLEVLEHIMETNKLLCRAMLCITNHMIDGNGVKEMKETRDEIQDLLTNM